MADRDTVELAAMILVGLFLVLLVLERVFRGSIAKDGTRRGRQPMSTSKTTAVALIFVVLLVVALLLGRLLLGLMAVAGLLVFGTLALSRGPRGPRGTRHSKGSS